MTRTLRRLAATSATALALGALAVVDPLPAFASLPSQCATDEGPTVTCTFRGEPGASFDLRLPTGVAQVHLHVVGEAGGLADNAAGSAIFAENGRPAVVEADVPTVGGDWLEVEFRANGGDGGGHAGGGGGSAVVQRARGPVIAEAGGGGGAGDPGKAPASAYWYSAGGDAGVPGGDSYSVAESGYTAIPARGGQQGSETGPGTGGAGGVADAGTPIPFTFAHGSSGGGSADGSLHWGGAGGAGGFGGGGGGGGTNGGGGGGAGGTGNSSEMYGGGGGGGSSTIPSGGSLSVTSSESAVVRITFALDGHAAYSSTALDFGRVPVGSAGSAQSLTLTNAGPGPMVVGAAGITGTGVSSFAFAGDGCTQGLGLLEVGSSCEISVTFRPTAAGAAAATLTIQDSSDTGSASVSLSGVGTIPVASAAPTAVDFGPNEIGAAASPRTVTLTNTGDADLVVGTVTLSGDPDFTVTSDACTGTTVAPGHSCAVALGFQPTELSNRAGTLKITHNAGAATWVPLSGAGTTQADLKVLGVGSVYTGRDHLVTRTVAGSGTLQTYPLVVLNEDSVAHSYTIRIAESGSQAKTEIWSTGLGGKALLPYGNHSFTTAPIAPHTSVNYSLRVTPFYGQSTSRVEVLLQTDFGATIESLATETNTAAPANGTSSFELFARQGSQAFIGGPTAGQTTTGPALNVGGSAAYTIRLKNNGSTRNQVGLRLTDVDGCAGSFAVTAAAAGKVRTADAYAGTFLTPVLAPGGYQDVQVTIRRASAGCRARMVRAQSLDHGVVVRTSYLLSNAAYDATTD